MKEFWIKYRTFFFMFLFCASIIFYMSRKVVEKDSQLVKMKMELIAKDTLLKVSEGKYRKMVNYYSSKKDLSNQVKETSPEIYNLINKNNEKILSNTNVDFTFKPQESINVINKKDSIYTFTSFYPKKENNFIQFDGSLNINSNQITEKWSFNSIKLDVVLTQKEDGLWNSYLNAPEYVKVNSMKINSLPPKEYIPTQDKPKTFVFYGGIGMRSGLNTIKTFNDKDLTINGALTIKNKVMIEANFGTDKKVGASVLFKF